MCWLCWCWCSMFIGSPYKMKKFNSSSIFAFGFLCTCSQVCAEMIFVNVALFALSFRMSFKDVTCFVISSWIWGIGKMRVWVMRRFHNKSNENLRSKISRNKQNAQIYFSVIEVIMLLRTPNMACRRQEADCLFSMFCSF